MNCHYYWIVIASVIIAALAFWSLGIKKCAARLKKENEQPENNDKKNVADVDYHNNKIYEDVKLFIQITTALSLGVGFVLNKGCQNYYNMLCLIQITHSITVFLVCISIIAHQRSKIIRWQARGEVHYDEVWSWQEVWIIISILIFGYVFSTYTIG